MCEIDMTRKADAAASVTRRLVSVPARYLRASSQQVLLTNRTKRGAR